jgi:hypothetical protein
MNKKSEILVWLRIAYKNFVPQLININIKSKLLHQGKKPVFRREKTGALRGKPSGFNQWRTR